MKYCAQPGCPTIVPDGRCRQHARAQDQARGSARDRGYDHAWALYSRRWKRAHPFCGERADGQLWMKHSRCAQAGRLVPAQVTDHIVPMARGGDKWDPANHQSLCTACNTAKGNRV